MAILVGVSQLRKWPWVLAFHSRCDSPRFPSLLRCIYLLEPSVSTIDPFSEKMTVCQKNMGMSLKRSDSELNMTNNHQPIREEVGIFPRHLSHGNDNRSEASGLHSSSEAVFAIFILGSQLPNPKANLVCRTAEKLGCCNHIIIYFRWRTPHRSENPSQSWLNCTFVLQ
jgi:hypothetical protein